MKKPRYFIVRALLCFFFEQLRMPEDITKLPGRDVGNNKGNLANSGPATLNPIQSFVNICNGEPRFEILKRNQGLIRMTLTSFLVCLFCGASAQNRNGTIKGRVVDEMKIALPSVTVRIVGQKGYVSSDSNGNFMLTGVIGDSILLSSIGFQELKLRVNSFSDLGQLMLIQDKNQLKDVEVVSTGYQQVAKERSTGSFVQLDEKLLNRRIGTNLLDRLEGVTSGLSFNRNTSTSNGSNPSSLSVRGRSTIFANPNPLIVIDNFPFSGDLSAINPNDIASITVLKDAAAASIWGALSGNGVIVITTKRGRNGSAPRVDFNASLNLSEKPDLYRAPRLSSASFIEIEKFLFDKGYYNSKITSSAHPVLSPVVEILLQRKNGQISPLDSAKLISAYANTDTRDDLSRYFYRRAVNQQYSLSISGGSEKHTYYLGTGLDRNLTNLQRTGFDRMTINGSNTFFFAKKKLEWTTALYYTRNRSLNNGINSSLGYPYLKLKNPDGSNASVPYQYRKPYIDTLGNGKLLNWNFRPLDELEQNDNKTTLTEYRLNTLLKYSIFTGLDVSVQYQYNEGNSISRTLYTQDRFYTRDYINRFTQVSPGGIYTRLVPLGGILDNRNSITLSQNIRGQLAFSRKLGSRHELSAILGMEAREVRGNSSSNRLYGYTETGAAGAINYQGTFIMLPTNSTGMIESGLSQLQTSNRFVSSFANAAYIYSERYTFSLSGRKDESNVFGATTNQKGIPLWSVGAGWEISKESFYRLDQIPYLRLRLTKGYQGNVDNSLSPQVTVSNNPLSLNIAGSPYSALSSPPNPDLRWEKISMFNVGLDFRTQSNRVQGTFEFFSKYGRDLIGISAIDPTSGVQTFKGNSANMSVKGFDLTLNSRNTVGGITWSCIFLLSVARDKVTKYLLNPPTVSSALTGGISPIVGSPLYAIYALKWAGLNSTGDPQVMLNGQPSTNYAAILGSSDLSNLKYIGPANPPFFGSLRNDFDYKGWNISINVTYKFGHYFRNPGLGYANIFTGNIGYSDSQYLSRWKKPGDEAFTNVPSMIYPANANRDMTYNYSDILVERGDHIRLQDINIGYDFAMQKDRKNWFRSLRVYAYLNNLGILWSASKLGLDPDYLTSTYANPRSIAFGIRAGL